ncbi:hypothetical protein F4776DRAFT_612325 [Hypoxylon sp. NC0597]|nr:hypothetical protein F4776DRAFT_612325 [Hypoxylon sp. NC0597]
MSADITEAVDCLLKLSVSIRTPAPHDRLKASSRMDISPYEAFDISHVATKFELASPKLAEHLGRANSRRRQFFMYRASHHAILSDGLNEDHDKSVFGKLSTVASSIPQSLKNKSLDPKIELIDEDEVSEGGITPTSYATTRGDIDRPHIPALPDEASKGPFECPFCFMMISVSSRRAWKKHIFADLRPYNCLIVDCPFIGSDFSRRREWIDHMSQKHWRFWHCAFCDHLPFDSSELLRDHLQRCHLEDVSEDQLRASAELYTSHRPLDNTSSCPLCREPTPSAREYKRHVGRHLEDIALFVLPRGFDDASGEDTSDERPLEGTDDDSVTRLSDSSRMNEEVAVLEEAQGEEREEIGTEQNVMRHSSHTSLTRPPNLLPTLDDLFPNRRPTLHGPPETATSLLELNEYRTARIAEILSDFRNLQYYIATAPVDPPNTDDYYTEGWAALRQCSIDGHHILNVAADITVPQTGGGEAEQARAELKQVLLDSYARRHEGQKIYLRQAAAQRWIEYRESVLQGQRPNSSHRRQLRACDDQLRSV